MYSRKPPNLSKNNGSVAFEHPFLPFPSPCGRSSNLNSVAKKKGLSLLPASRTTGSYTISCTNIYGLVESEGEKREVQKKYLKNHDQELSKFSEKQ